MLNLIYKAIPGTFANICNALEIEYLKLDHDLIQFVRAEHAMFHVTLICSDKLLSQKLFLYIVNTDPVTLIIVLFSLTNFSYVL